MSTRNLEYFFHPRSVALIGASGKPASVGATVLANLASAGFTGPIWPINPAYTSLQGLPCYPDIEALPGTPDLAVIATPAATVPALIDALGRRGTRAVVVISAGFAERGTREGQALHDAALAAARPWLLRIMGPNTIGLLVPESGLNASFAHLLPQPGRIAFVTQSGALLTSVMDWADSRAIGFSSLIALGSMADVDFGDVLDYLASDDKTDAILLYVEAITHARKFMSAARAAARTKPVIVCKSGRHAAGAKAAQSHTGALAGADAVYDAAFRRAGMLRVLTLEELFDAVEGLATVHPPAGDRLAIITNGGGVGVMATDRLMDIGGHLAELTASTLAGLDAVLPAAWSHGNPIDIIGDATEARYAQTIEQIVSAPEVDATLILHVPVSVVSPTRIATSVINACLAHPDATVLTSWIGGKSVTEARNRFVEAKVPTFDTPGEAIQAFVRLIEYQRVQKVLLETPAVTDEPFVSDLTTARQLIEQALKKAEKNELKDGQTFLDPVSARALARAYGIPVLPIIRCRSATAAARAAANTGGMVALKIWSPDITHKTDVGGVMLNLEGYDAVLAAARAMRKRITRERPDARLTGFTIEPMQRARDGHELIIGAYEDRQFGPVILFGHGGIAVELLDDKAIGLPPLNRELARDLINRTRISRLLTGFRGLPPVDLAAIEAVICRVSQLVIELPEVIELDINPLLADSRGICALDVRVRIARPLVPGAGRLTIRPYPAELEERLAAVEGRRELLLRPIRATDGLLLQHVDFASDDFLYTIQNRRRLMSRRLTQIDYDREIVFLLLDPSVDEAGSILGIAVLHADPDGVRADLGLAVRRNVGQQEVAWFLDRLTMSARLKGIEKLQMPAADDDQLKRVCDIVGFRPTNEPDTVEMKFSVNHSMGNVVRPER